MHFTRLLPLALLALVLTVLAGSAAAQPYTSGGVQAEPPQQGPGGGGMAPETSGDAGAAQAAPDAEAGQEPTPTTPGGEPQPGDPQEPSDPEEPDTEEPDVDSPEPTPDVPDDDDGAGEQGGGGGDGGGFLPRTGLEVAAFALIGLGLLIAGVALRPRRLA
jgi:hypothetical protein